MSPLVPLDIDTDSVLTRRFPVQQLSAKGVLKARAIDDFAESRVNDTTLVTRRIRMDSISDLLAIARHLSRSCPGRPLTILKSDFRAAYRSLPILTEHLEFAQVAVVDPTLQQVLCATQFAMPFGAVGAVYSWDLVGEAVVYILRNGFGLPVLRYVDDLFLIVYADLGDHCRSLLIAVVSALGFVLAPDKTPLPSPSQVVLGVALLCKAASVFLTIDPDKLSFWITELRRLLSDDTVPPAAFAQLAGRLAFGCAAVWGSLPRARLRPLHRAAASLSVSRHELSAALRWLLAFASASRPTVRHLAAPPPVDFLYTDASSRGHGTLGAVFIPAAGTPSWFTLALPEPLADLTHRKTQIIALESLAVLVALRVWGPSAALRHLVIFVDNSCALSSCRRGVSSAGDLSELAHIIQQLLYSLRLRAHFFWVPSALNLADPPSRGRTAPLGAQVSVPPGLAQVDLSRSQLRATSPEPRPRRCLAARSPQSWPLLSRAPPADIAARGAPRERSRSPRALKTRSRPRPF